jgi:hypothetical protein
MNPDPRIEIGKALVSLAIARGTVLDEATSEVYLDLLQDLHHNFVSRACRVFARKTRKEFEPAMPSVGAIRDLALDCEVSDRHAAKRMRLEPPKRDVPRGTPHCHICRDTSWQEYLCEGLGTGRGPNPALTAAGVANRNCERPGSHAPHTFVGPCACRPTNPVLFSGHGLRS